MTISVIIPIFNGATFIEGAIQNVLSQTLLPQEIIVVDDGSTDTSAEIIKKFPQVIYKHQDNQGPSAARNTGLEIANSDLISFLDCDDLYPANKLQLLYNYFTNDSNLIAAIGTMQYFFDEEKDRIGYSEIHEGNISNHVLLGAGLFKKSIFETIGNFDEKLLFSEDFDWYQRLYASKEKIIKIEDCCLFYRRHANNYTNSKKEVQKGFLQALHKAMALKKEQKMDKKITAIIAVYNGEQYIESAIKSILNQTIVITEIIIIDDGSTDATIQKIEAFQLSNIILLKQQNCGQAKAINSALTQATGDFITFLDADDIWKSNKTALQLAAFEKNPTAQLCFGGMEEFISSELPIEEQQKIRVNPVTLDAKVRPCMMIKREVMQDFGNFPEVPTMDFIAWYASIKPKITCEIFVDAIVLERRLHLNNVSRLERKKVDIATTFKVILEQRRKANQSNG